MERRPFSRWHLCLLDSVVSHCWKSRGGSHVRGMMILSIFLSVVQSERVGNGVGRHALMPGHDVQSDLVRNGRCAACVHLQCTGTLKRTGGLHYSSFNQRAFVES